MQIRIIFSLCLIFLLISCDLFIKLNESELLQDEKKSESISLKGYFIGDAGELDNPISITISPDGRDIYITNGGDIDNVVWFKRDAKSGKLTCNGEVSNTITNEDLTYIAISPDGKNVYAIDYGPFELLIFNRDITSGKLDYIKRVYAYEPKSILVPYDGKSLYIGCFDSISYYFDRDINTGDLDDNGYIYHGSNGYFVDMVISQLDKHIYTVDDSNNNVVFLERNENSGYSLKDTYLFANVCSIAIHPNDKYVYAIDSTGSIQVYERDLNKGDLDMIQNYSVSHSSLSKIAVTNDWEKLFYIDYTNSLLGWCNINTNGKLSDNNSLTISNPIINNAKGICISPDSKYIYIIGEGSSSVAWFEREK